jgi:hypothetical protein
MPPLSTIPRPLKRGRESLDFQTRLKTAMRLDERFSFSKQRFSPGLRTWLSQPLGPNPLILLRPILADFVSGSAVHTAISD